MIIDRFMRYNMDKKFYMRGPLIVFSGLLISGCGSQKPAPTVSVSQPVVIASQVVPQKGMENILGLTARQLEQTFGKARLDVREANGRKLQFNGKACIMDVYLYVPEGKNIAVATHVDARRSDGAEVDRSSCVKALSR